MKISKIIRKISIMSLGFSIYLFSMWEQVDSSVSMPVEQQETIAKLLKERDKNPYIEEKTPLYTTRPQNVNQTIKTTKEPLE